MCLIFESSRLNLKIAAGLVHLEPALVALETKQKHFLIFLFFWRCCRLLVLVSSCSVVLLCAPFGGCCFSILFFGGAAFSSWVVLPSPAFLGALLSSPPCGGAVFLPPPLGPVALSTLRFGVVRPPPSSASLGWCWRSRLF